MSHPSCFNKKYGRYQNDAPLCAWQADRSCGLSKIRVRASSSCQSQRETPSFDGQKYGSIDFCFKQTVFWVCWALYGSNENSVAFLRHTHGLFLSPEINILVHHAMFGLWIFLIDIRGHFPCVYQFQIGLAIWMQSLLSIRRSILNYHGKRTHNDIKYVSY